MPKIGKNPYTEEMLQEALDAVKKGMPKKEAARRFGVPKATIQFRLSAKFTKSSLGPSPVLTVEEEELLVEWIITCSKKGQPRRWEDLRLSVKEMLEKCKRPNPFTHNMPGKGWYQAFLRRHPQISLRTPEEVTRASACVSENNIRQWFTDVQESLKEDDALDILEDPTRMFNCDETGFSLNPNSGKVMAAKGERNVYEIDKGPAKTNITVLYCFSASGLVVPPLIVYPYLRIPADISKSVADAAGDEDWGIGHSENGWMTSEVFYEYVGKIFNNFLNKKGVKKPVILFVDGHKTHLTYELSKICESLEIVLVVLYPNATRILQPCDVGVFRPLKAAWKVEALNWYRNNPGEIINKISFASILKMTLSAITESTTKNAFRACGLHPFDADSIDFSKCLGTGKTAPICQQEPEKYLRKTDFHRILGSSMNIVNKEPENVAEQILKTIYAAFSATAPPTPEQIVNVTFPAATVPPVSQAIDLAAPSTSRDTQPTLVPPVFQAIDIEAPSTSRAPQPTLVPPVSQAIDIEAPSTSRAPQPTLGSPLRPSLRSILDWPLTPKRKGTRRLVKRRDYVVSSKKWRKEYEEESEMKKRKAEEIEERRNKREEMRKQKKDLKNKQCAKRKTKKKKLEIHSESSDSSFNISSGESIWHESDQESGEETNETQNSQPVQRSIGEYVVFQYDGKLFPGKITALLDDEATISSMVRVGRLWKWPDRPDILSYPWESVIAHISSPKKTSKTRNLYYVPELSAE